MIFNRQDKKYYLKNQQKYFLNHSKGIYKFLYLNNEPIKSILVQWLKNENEIQSKLACWQNFNYNYCFLITNKQYFKTTNFLMHVDIVNVDLNYKIKNIWTNVAPNTELFFPKHFGHLFIFKANTIYGYGIQLEKTLFTAIKY